MTLGTSVPLYCKMYFDGSDLILGRQGCGKHKVREMRERQQAEGRGGSMIDFDLLKNAFSDGGVGFETGSASGGGLDRLDTLRSAKSGSRGLGKGG